MYGRKESSLYQGKSISNRRQKNNNKTTKNPTIDIHNNNKLRNLYICINIHPTQTHMIAEPSDSPVRMK